MDCSIRMMDVRLSSAHITTDAAELGSGRGGSISIQHGIEITLNHDDTTKVVSNKMACVISTKLIGTPSSTEPEDSQAETFSVDVSFLAQFEVDDSIAEGLVDDQKRMNNLSVRFANCMFPALRTYLTITLDLIGVSGYRLPWHVDGLEVDGS